MNDPHRMHIWLLTAGEPLPIDPGGPSLMRTGILAGLMRRRGHRVTWITSALNHVARVRRFDSTTAQLLSDGTELVMLRGGQYRRTVSLARILHHQALARAFRHFALRADRPDGIVAAMPTTELARDAVRVGKYLGVPVLVDIRDLWPDIWLELVPELMRGVARLALAPFYSDLRLAMTGAAGIIGPSDGVVAWGLGHARRPRGATDATIPLAYDEARPTSGETREALDYWAALGVTPRTDIVTIVYAGSMTRRIELETVTRSIGLVNKAGVAGVRFVLCGDGEAAESVRAAIAGAPNVIAPGWVSAPRLRALLSMSSVGWIPYPSSADWRLFTPNKFAEYLAAGLPVFSSLAGETASRIDEARCGWTYRNGDALEAARLISEMPACEEQRRQMGAASRRLFEARYAAERVYAHYADFIEEVVARHRAG